MITKAIIDKVISDYEVIVRIPILDSADYTNQGTDVNDLTSATVCVIPNMQFHPVEGDIVFVGFEDKDLGKPIILGCLSKEDGNKSSATIKAACLDADSTVYLSENTTIGDITYKQLKASIKASQTTEDLNSYLKLSGGTMTGEINIGQDDGKGIQLGTNGRINATLYTNPSSTTNTVLGLVGNNLVLGSNTFDTKIRGKTISLVTPNGEKSFLDTVFPIGSIYTSTEKNSPASIFGGTWEKLTGDAYFKIIDQDASSEGDPSTKQAGKYAGTSSEHKIPIESMPSHNHTIHRTGNGGGNWTGMAGSPSNEWQGWVSTEIGYTGGGQAYYPYYYGVYAWRRQS